MKIIHAFILGIVQGFTEFLPVSSSGHLVLLEDIFNIENDILFFDLMLHLATLLAVIIFYRKKIWQLIKKPFSPLMLYLIMATFPTVIIAFAFKDFFVSSFSGEYLIIGFLITCIFLTLIQNIQTKYKLEEKMSVGKSIVVGLFQGLSIMPGISRSGSTITASIIQGVNQEEAADFSFLISIPVILGSSVLQFVDIIKNDITLSISVWCIIVGMITSFIFGILSIKFMTNIIKKNKYHIFIIYLLCLSILILILKSFTII
ncbi:MAG: undecaprenyl-diphosphate phosphatase [Clostridia bacterium]|nr:undecaprenyl-diphosphate phosphatase [Clostridia bacterium]